jgi:hypothetical protein
VKVLAWAIGLVFLAGLLVASCVALVNDEDSMGRVQLVSHDYECQSHDGCDDWGGSGSDGNTGYGGEGGQGGDTDQRGDHNCRNFCFYGVPLPGAEPQSLFPPTPDGIRKFVLAAMQGGIEMGRLFADTTITFVSNLLIGIA